ncbi:hypothetical protein JXB41_07465 [Candidatus Woesearchaeota archaeon]|nr:hypothetical protein [Candidatus Woesearchaeota archaeon]
MVSITLSVPENLRKEMTLFPEINWSAIAREAIKKRIIMMKKFKEFTKDSTFTEKDALELGKKVSATAMKRHRK